MSIIPLPVSFAEVAKLDKASAMDKAGKAGEVGAPLDAEPFVIVDPSIPPEGYRLDTSAERPLIAASDAAGEHYARLTLRQLAVAVERERASSSGGNRESKAKERLPAVLISDAPRFSWRGTMLDVARHFLPVESVLAYIDDLAELKLNRLHLHLTDDQGWRIQIDSRPRLTEIGAQTAVGGDTGGYYSKADYRRIVEHAASQHIVVIPEIDLPGHTNAALTAYPDLAVAGVHPAPYEGIEVGFSTLDPRNEESYRFVSDVISEVAEMTPGPWLHIGGDECLSTPEPDFLNFIARASRIAAASGKTVIGWHEMGRSRALPAGTIGQYWNYTKPQGSHAEHLLSFVAQGGKVILSPADAAYFDIKYTSDYPLGLIWPGKPTTLEDAYGWEPTAVIAGLAESDIIGIEAPIFTETIADLDQLRTMAFPRMAAFAELAWSQRPEGERNFADFAARLAAFAASWDERGVRYERVGSVPWRARN